MAALRLYRLRYLFKCLAGVIYQVTLASGCVPRFRFQLFWDIFQLQRLIIGFRFIRLHRLLPLSCPISILCPGVNCRFAAFGSRIDRSPNEGFSVTRRFVVRCLLFRHRSERLIFHIKRRNFRSFFEDALFLLAKADYRRYRYRAGHVRKVLIFRGIVGLFLCWL